MPSKTDSGPYRDELTLRPATAADYAFLADLHRQTFAGYTAQTWGWNEGRLTAEFRQAFESSVRQVVYLERQAIGSLVVADEGDSLFLDYLAILPTYQRTGIGTKLIQMILDKVARRAIAVRLHVLPCIRPKPFMNGSASVWLVVIKIAIAWRHVPVPTR